MKHQGNTEGIDAQFAQLSGECKTCVRDIASVGPLSALRNLIPPIVENQKFRVDTTSVKEEVHVRVAATGRNPEGHREEDLLRDGRKGWKEKGEVHAQEK